MTRIHKSYAYSICHINFFVVIAADQTADRTNCIIDIIQRNYFCSSGSLSFSVFPLCFEHLNVRTVPQHNIAQIRCRFCCKNLSAESSLVQKWKLSGMIDMCMCQKHHINITGSNRNLLIFKLIRSLFHSAVNQNIFPTGFQIRTASCDLMCCPQKCNPHKNTFSLFYVSPLASFYHIF